MTLYAAATTYAACVAAHDNQAKNSPEDCKPLKGLQISCEANIEELGVCRLQHEVSSKEQLWAKNAELDGRLAKMSERNERLVDDLRDSETAAASAKGWSSPSTMFASTTVR